MAITNRHPFKNNTSLTSTNAFVMHQVTPSCTYAVVEIRVVNTTSGPASISIGISDDGTLPNTAKISHEVSLPSTGDGIIRSQIFVAPTERIVVSGTVGLDVRVSGIEYTATGVVLQISKASLAGGNVDTVVFPTPSSSLATISDVNIVNTSGTDTTFRLSITDSGTPTSAGTHIEYDNVIPVDSFTTNSCGLITSTEEIRASAGGPGLYVRTAGLVTTP